MYCSDFSRAVSATESQAWSRSRGKAAGATGNPAQNDRHFYQSRGQMREIRGERLFLHIGAEVRAKPEQLTLLRRLPRAGAESNVTERLRN